MLLSHQQLEDRLMELHQASLQIVGDVSLESLLKRIATVACEQVQARYAALGVFGDNGKLKQFVSVGMTQNEILHISHPPVGSGLLGLLKNSDHPIRISNISSDSRSAGFPKNHPAMETFLGVPILLGDVQLGQIYLTEKLNHEEFSLEDENIIMLLANYAAVAINNARNYEELKLRDQALTRRNQDLALLNNIAGVLTASLKLDEILHKTLSLVMDYMEVESGEIFLLEDDKQTLRLVLHRGQAADVFWTRNRFMTGEGIIGLVAKTGEAVVSHDLAHDMRYLRDAVVDAGFKQMACFPLASSGNLVGVLSAVTRGSTPLNDHDIQVITAIGSWAGLAIENARLHSESRRLAILEERDRIGMDLHDGIIQSIYGVGLVLEHARLLANEEPAKAADRIQLAINSLDHTIRDIRSYILDLRPRQFADENLMDGLRRLVMEFRINTLAEANLIGNQDELKEIPSAHAMVMFHICQEALANAAKHGHPKKVDVSVWTSPERIVLEVQDNGQGFEIEKMSMTLGHGLSNMLTRARHVGGDVEITSTIGEGTSIMAWIPRNPQK